MNHLKFIDSLICVCCGAENPTHHHLLRVNRQYCPAIKGTENLAFPKIKSHGVGVKNDDRFALPLCPACHQRLHLSGNEREFLKYLNINYPEKLCLELYKVSGNREKAMDLIRWTRLGRV